MYIKIDGTNTESLPCRGSTLEKFTAKINRIKIVNGMDKFHWFWDFEDLIEKSNNLLNDNPEIEFLELSTGIDNSPKYETKDELWLKISWYKTPSLKSKSIFEDKSSYSSFSEIIKDE